MPRVMNEILTVGVGPDQTSSISGRPFDIPDDERRSADVATDDGIISRAVAGDREAFGSLYRRCHGPIYRYCRVHLGADGEDAAAETFVRAWEGLPRFKKTGAPFLAWLYGIARHVVADALRAAARTIPVAELPDQPEDLDPVATLDLIRAISELPEDQRRVIEMKYLLGMRNPEVAAAMGKKVGAVNAQQWRALAALNKKLST
jgi:RNA polymerase sigma-70 factor, ECF subfamily